MALSAPGTGAIPDRPGRRRTQRRPRSELGNPIAHSGPTGLPTKKLCVKNLLSLVATRTRHVGDDANVELYDPDLWTDEFAFLNLAWAGCRFKAICFYDYRARYVVQITQSGKHGCRGGCPGFSFSGASMISHSISGEPERYRKDVPNLRRFIYSTAGISHLTPEQMRSRHW